MWYVNHKIRTDVQGSVLKYHTHLTIRLGDICKKHRLSTAEMHSNNPLLKVLQRELVLLQSY